MNFKILLLIPFILGASLSAQADSICSQPHLAKLVAQGTPAFKQKAFTEKLQSSQVVIAGDVHFLTNQEAIGRLIFEFQKHHNKNACVAFELPARDYGANVFLSNLVEIIKEVEAHADYKTDVDMQNYANSLMRLHAYYFPLTEYALSLKLKTKSVDHKDKWNNAMPMDARNQAMNENIQKLITSKECSSVLLIVGKSHLSSESKQSKIQDILKAKLKVTTINLQMTQEAAMPEEIRSWQICEQTKDIKLNELSVLSSQNLKGQPALMGHIQWKDFDFSLLIP